MLSKLHFAITTIMFVGVLFLAYQNFSSSHKLVYVDSGKLINGYQGMIKARAEFQKKTSLWKANIDTLASEVQRQIGEFEKNRSGMTEREKKLSEELIRSKQKQLYDYQKAMNTQAQEEDSKMTAEVIDQMNRFLKTYGKDKGYEVIMAATEYGNIAYAAEGLDITDEVLKKLNENYSGK